MKKKKDQDIIDTNPLSFSATALENLKLLLADSPSNRVFETKIKITQFGRLILPARPAQNTKVSRIA
jgi:hypothetical protein